MISVYICAAKGGGVQWVHHCPTAKKWTVCYKKCRLSSSLSQRKHEFRVVLGSSLVC